MHFYWLKLCHRGISQQNWIFIQFSPNEIFVHLHNKISSNKIFSSCETKFMFIKQKVSSYPHPKENFFIMTKFHPTKVFSYSTVDHFVLTIADHWALKGHNDIDIGKNKLQGIINCPWYWHRSLYKYHSCFMNMLHSSMQYISNLQKKIPKNRICLHK